MKADVQSAVFRALLYNLNKGIKTVNLQDIKLADDSYILSDLDTEEYMMKLCRDGILHRRDYKTFDVIADIGAIRGYVLSWEAENNASGGNSSMTSADEILNSRWTPRGQNDKKSKEESGANSESEKKTLDKLVEVTKKIKTAQEELIEQLTGGKKNRRDGQVGEHDDDLYQRVLKYCIERKRVSVADICLHFPIGYVCANRAVKWMEENGFIRSAKMSDDIKILIDMDTYRKLFDSDDDDEEDIDIDDDEDDEDDDDIDIDEEDDEDDEDDEDFEIEDDEDDDDFEIEDDEDGGTETARKCTDEDYEKDAELYRKALRYCIERGFATVSLIQRHFPIGYAKSCKIIDWMEDNDFIRRSVSGLWRMRVNEKDYENFFGISFNEDPNEETHIPADESFNAFNREEMKRKAMRVAEQFTDDTFKYEEKNEFEDRCMEIIELVVKLDEKQERAEALEVAKELYEIYLKKEPADQKLRVLERVVREFAIAEDDEYLSLRRQIFEE